MNHQEILGLMSYLKSIYPNYYKDDYKSTVMSWEDALIEEKAKFIMLAARQYVKTDVENRHPSIGRLISIAGEIRKEQYEESKSFQIEVYIERTPEEQLIQDKAREECCKKLGALFIPNYEYSKTTQ